MPDRAGPALRHADPALRPADPAAPLPDRSSWGLAATDRRAVRTLRPRVQAAMDALREAQPAGPGRRPPLTEEQVRLGIREALEAYQRAAVGTLGAAIVDEAGVALRLLDDLTGLGVLGPAIRDPAVEEIEVLDYATISVRCHGRRWVLPDLYYDSEEEFVQAIRRAVERVGERFDAGAPLLECDLPGVGRLSATLGGISTRGACLNLRKPVARVRSLGDLVALGTLPRAMAQLLDLAVRAKAGIIVAGAPGTGKTTVAAALLRCIPRDQTAVVVEDDPELAYLVPDEHLRCWVTRTANSEGAGAITLAALLRHALRFWPGYVAVGETRGASAWWLLRALGNGNGGISTVHADAPAEALEMLADYAVEADVRVDLAALRRQVVRRCHLVIQMGRVAAPDGRARRIVTDL